MRFFNHLAGMKMIFSSAIALSFLLFASTGCEYDVDDEINPIDTLVVCDTSAQNFQKVRDIFQQGTCLECHTGATAESGLDLSTYSGASAYLTSNPTTLIDRIRGTAGDIMPPPPREKLDSCNVFKISAWINAGLPE